MPTQMREWNPLGIDRSATSPNFSEAAATSTQQPTGGTKPSPRQKRADPAADSRPKLPGFVNAFDSLSPHPASQSQSARAKGKQREGGGMTAEEAERNFFAPSQPSPSQHALSLRMFQSPPSPPSSPLGQKLARRNAANHSNSRHSPQRASPRRATQSPAQTQLYATQDVEMADSQEEADDEEVAEEFSETDWAAEVWSAFTITCRKIVY